MLPVQDSPTLHVTLLRAYLEPGPHHFVRLAKNVLIEHDLPVPEQDCLDRIVRAALDAQHLFYSAAVYGPTECDLLSFFEGFILQCASRISS